jgi:hypothetical protein
VGFGGHLDADNHEGALYCRDETPVACLSWRDERRRLFLVYSGLRVDSFGDMYRCCAGFVGCLRWMGRVLSVF